MPICSNHSDLTNFPAGDSCSTPIKSIADWEVSEYGAGSYPGLHALPGSGAPSEFSAELREEILKATWVAFDELRKDGELQGEQMHALHDFKQRGGTYHDVGGMNFKGLYARDRSPKDHARVALSERYGRIARGEDESRCS